MFGSSFSPKRGRTTYHYVKLTDINQGSQRQTHPVTQGEVGSASRVVSSARRTKGWSFRKLRPHCLQHPGVRDCPMVPYSGWACAQSCARCHGEPGPEHGVFPRPLSRTELPTTECGLLVLVSPALCFLLAVLTSTLMHFDHSLMKVIGVKLVSKSSSKCK